MLLYYITDSWQFSGDKDERRSRLLENIEEAARCGVDLIQLRERDLSPGELESLASDAVTRVRKQSATTMVLINSRVDVAIASGVGGVHLRSALDLSASEARNIFHKAGATSATVCVSCHTLQDVYAAEAHGADFAVFGPVFGKVISGSDFISKAKELPGVGIAKLYEVCHREAAASSRMPVLALGGVNLKNAGECLNSGAAGIAAIRLFQPADLRELESTVAALRKNACLLAESAERRHPYQS